MADVSMQKKADKKVVFIGDSGVGKTSLIRRYIDQIFILGTPHTIGASFFVKHWNGVTIALWDTAGQEGFGGIRTFYARNAHAVILCYNIGRHSTFQSLIDTHSKLLENVAPNCILVLVGTKLDLVGQLDDKGELVKREVSQGEVEEMYLMYKEQMNCLDHPKGLVPIFETSSKQDDKVSAVFEYVFQTLAQSKQGKKDFSCVHEDSIQLTSVGRERVVEINCCQ